MARPAPVYAQLPVYQYQTFDNFSFTATPRSTPSKSSAVYYRPVTDVAPKPEEKPTETPPEPPLEPINATEGRNYYGLLF